MNARFDRVAIAPELMNGQLCIRGTRRVVEAVAPCPDRAELKREYSKPEGNDIRQALGLLALGLAASDLNEQTPASGSE